MKKTNKNVSKISSTQRLEELLTETESELEALAPQIEKLEKQIEKLKDLKKAKQKLITLKLSIKSILSNFSEVGSEQITTIVTNFAVGKEFSENPARVKFSPFENTSRTSETLHSGELFIPEQAFREVNTVLRKQTSLNYELFRAIVFKGGKASTEEIKRFLVENNIKQPATGEGFGAVELTDISSRVNYLVRKGVVTPDGKGVFISNFGWSRDQEEVLA